MQHDDGKTVLEPRPWSIAFGTGLDAQQVNTLFFAAGPNDEADGVYGRIDVRQQAWPERAKE